MNPLQRTPATLRPDASPREGAAASAEGRGARSRDAASGLPLQSRTATPSTLGGPGRWDQLQAAERRGELDALRHPARAGQPLTSKQHTLAAYLTARAADGRAIDGEDLDRLQRGNDAVHATRTSLAMGRGNVKSDIDATHHASSHHMLVARALAKDLTDVPEFRGEVVDYVAANAAGALFVQAGNCGEFSAVTVGHLTGHLRDEERAEIVRMRNIDHAFAAIRSSGGHESRVVLDAWAAGSAVMAPDGRFTESPGENQTQLRLDKRATAGFTYQVFRDLNVLRNEVPATELQNAVHRLRQEDVKLEDDLVWEEQPVVSDRFAARALEKMVRDAQPPAGEAGSVGDPMKAVRNEVHAAGAVRSLGYDVQTAVASAPSVAQRARHLTD